MKECKRQLLLVDDDRDIRDSLAEILRDEGYHVDQARHGAEALSALREGPLPCAILLDLMMPVMDGRQFLEAQLRSPRIKEIPVILLTASRNTDEAFATSGSVELITKPIDLGRLLAAVARACGSGLA